MEQASEQEDTNVRKNLIVVKKYREMLSVLYVILVKSINIVVVDFKNND